MSDAPVQLTDPTPDAVVEFIGRVCETPWPEDAAAFTASALAGAA